MENSSLSTPASDRQLPPALGYTGAALALWIFRRPILALAGFTIHLALALVKPTLLILGTLKLAHLLQSSRAPAPDESPAQPAYPGDDEALLVPAHSVSST